MFSPCSSISSTVAHRFDDIHPSGRDFLLHHISSARDDEKDAVCGDTFKKYGASWKLWLTFLQSSSLDNNPFLDGRPINQINDIMCAFVRWRRTSRDGKPLVARYIKSTIGEISTTFREAGRLDPRHDSTGNNYFHLDRLFQAYKSLDPPPRREKAIPLSLLEHIKKNASTHLQKATAPLLIGALFFCMRSCEYLAVPNPEDKRTRPVVLGGVRFIKNNKILPFHHPDLTNADYVAITFAKQKNKDDMRTVHVEKADVADRNLCCVYNLALVCKRVASYHHHLPVLLRPLSLFQSEKGAFSQITNRYVIGLLRQATKEMGEEVLGFHAHEVGTHSIRSGGAMAYFLIPGMTDSRIKYFGRWNSDAFLDYIREQVDRFRKGFSTYILKHKHFRNIPSLTEEQSTLLFQDHPGSFIHGARSLKDKRLLVKSRNQSTCVIDGGGRRIGPGWI